MKSREEQWELLSSLSREEGLELFDVTWPAPRAATLKVFVAKKEKGVGVDVDECAALSRRILDHPDVEELLPGRCMLEVSSPGINRKLRLPEHFADAIGERVRVGFHEKAPSSDEKPSKRTVTGILLGFDGEHLELKEENSSRVWSIAFPDVTEARVDFLFT